MLERALELVFKQFWTFFLIAATITVPLNVAYAYSFRNVIAVQDLHDEIANFPDMRQVSGVGRVELSNATTFYAGLMIAEMGFLLLTTGAVKRAIQRDEEDELPTVVDSFKHLGSIKPERGRIGFRSKDIPALVFAAGISLVVWFLAQKLGLLVVQPLSADFIWVGDGLARGAAAALAAPFFLVPFALSLRLAKGTKGRTPTLY